MDERAKTTIQKGYFASKVPLSLASNFDKMPTDFQWIFTARFNAKFQTKSPPKISTHIKYFAIHWKICR